MSDTEVAPHDAGPVVTQEVAATCLGVKVPQSSFLTETRINRINAARYEGQEIAGALHVIREDDRVLEVGAGLGVVGAVIATNAKPEKFCRSRPTRNWSPSFALCTR